MVNKYYQKNKEKLQIFLKKKKKKGEKRPEPDIKIFLKKKKRKSEISEKFLFGRSKQIFL